MNVDLCHKGTGPQSKVTPTGDIATGALRCDRRGALKISMPRPHSTTTTVTIRRPHGPPTAFQPPVTAVAAALQAAPQPPHPPPLQCSPERLGHGAGNGKQLWSERGQHPPRPPYIDGQSRPNRNPTDSNGGRNGCATAAFPPVASRSSWGLPAPPSLMSGGAMRTCAARRVRVALVLVLRVEDALPQRGWVGVGGDGASRPDKTQSAFHRGAPTGNPILLHPRRRAPLTPSTPPHTHRPAQVRRFRVRPTGSTNCLTPHTPATPKLTLLPPPAPTPTPPAHLQGVRSLDGTGYTMAGRPWPWWHETPATRGWMVAVRVGGGGFWHKALGRGGGLAQGLGYGMVWYGPGPCPGYTGRTGSCGPTTRQQRTLARPLTGPLDSGGLLGWRHKALGRGGGGWHKALVSGGGGSAANTVPVRTPFVNFMFLLKNTLLMWVGAGVGPGGVWAAGVCQAPQSGAPKCASARVIWCQPIAAVVPRRRLAGHVGGLPGWPWSTGPDFNGAVDRARKKNAP